MREVRYLKETMAGRVLSWKSLWSWEMWENDMESMRNSTRSAPSSLAFSMEDSISAAVSHSSGVHTITLFCESTIGACRRTISRRWWRWDCCAWSVLLLDTTGRAELLYRPGKGPVLNLELVWFNFNQIEFKYNF